MPRPSFGKVEEKGGKVAKKPTTGTSDALYPFGHFLTTKQMKLHAAVSIPSYSLFSSLLLIEIASSKEP
mgnify:CR=1 FL=1